MIDFLCGVVTGVFTLLIIRSLLEHKGVDEILDEHNTEEWALEQFANVIAYPCPEGHAGLDELCDLPGVWVCVDRINLAHEIEERGYDYVISHNANPGDPGAWNEIGIDNKCGHGCKIYLNARTGTKILWHNSAYGCRQ